VGKTGEGDKGGRRKRGGKGKREGEGKWGNFGAVVIFPWENPCVVCPSVRLFVTRRLNAEARKLNNLFIVQSSSHCAAMNYSL